MLANGELHTVSPMKHDEKPRQAPDLLDKRMALSFAGVHVHAMAVKAAVVLGIPDILAEADGGKPLSAEEILAKLPTKSTPGPTSVSNLTRLMRPLVLRGVFSETLNSKNQPAYGLTEISECYTRENEPKADYVYSRPLQAMLGSLHEVILDEGAIPFTVGNGMPLYQYMEKHPEYSAMFNKVQVRLSTICVEETVNALEKSGWLEGVQTLVDVAGGRLGIMVGEIVTRNPQIKGINFDQPHVVEGAPEVKGVRFVGGDFLKEIPSGDAMLLQNIVHNHDDDVCIRILENCFKALPKGGKCILSEALVKEGLVKDSNAAKAGMIAYMDLLMMGYFKGGRQRTKDETEKLMQAAGFSQFRVLDTNSNMDLILGLKK